LAAAYEQAYAAGLLWEATNALVALTEYHANAGNDAEALRAARSAVLLATRQGETIRASRAILVAMLLLQTRHWREAPNVLGSGASSRELQPYYQQIMTYFEAELALLSDVTAMHGHSLMSKHPDGSMLH
jgi:hypothetical protein